MFSSTNIISETFDELNTTLPISFQKMTRATLQLQSDIPSQTRKLTIRMTYLILSNYFEDFNLQTLKIAKRFEKSIYSNAVDQQQYQHLIKLKLNLLVEKLKSKRKL